MLEEFRAWLNQEVLPIREKFGFHVEFMYVDNKNSEFIWAVSVQGSLDDFWRLKVATILLKKEQLPARSGPTVF